jgi:hypothetical protein
MNELPVLYRLKLKTRDIHILFLILSILLLPASTILAHGPKGHGGMEFTALQAAKKGIKLYDRLVETGKLAESWETDLGDIEVFSRQSDENREFVVKFSRSKGEPKSVYIFFSGKGDYTGSNFTGK